MRVKLVKDLKGYTISVLICWTFFWTLVLVAIVALCMDIVDMGKQPLYTHPFNGKFRFVAHFGIATWASGALASLLLI